MSTVNPDIQTESPLSEPHEVRHDLPGEVVPDDQPGEPSGESTGATPPPAPDPPAQEAPKPMTLLDATKIVTRIARMGGYDEAKHGREKLIEYAQAQVVRVNEAVELLNGYRGK